MCHGQKSVSSASGLCLVLPTETSQENSHCAALTDYSEVRKRISASWNMKLNTVIILPGAALAEDNILIAVFASGSETPLSKRSVSLSLNTGKSKYQLLLSCVYIPICQNLNATFFKMSNVFDYIKIAESPCHRGRNGGHTLHLFQSQREYFVCFIILLIVTSKSFSGNMSLLLGFCICCCSSDFLSPASVLSFTPLPIPG